MEETRFLCSFVHIFVTFTLMKGVHSIYTTMEHFKGGVCISSHTDIPKLGLSYIQCLDECRSRTACTVINLHVHTQYCRLNMNQSGNETTCPGYVLSKRSGWTKKDLSDCIGTTCNASQVCGVDNISGSPDCFYRECPQVDRLEHGLVLGNRRTIGARIMYICDDGYTLVGNGFRNCAEMGVWSGMTPICEQETTTSVTTTSVTTASVTTTSVVSTDTSTQTKSPTTKTTTTAKVYFFEHDD